MVRGNPAENVRSVFQEIELLSQLDGLGSRHLLRFHGAHEDRATAAPVSNASEHDDALAAGMPIPKITIVTEYCAGGQVFERIRDFGKYSEGAASVIFSKLARALLALHKAGIVHRDLKPENILLRGRPSTGAGAASGADSGAGVGAGSSAGSSANSEEVDPSAGAGLTVIETADALEPVLCDFGLALLEGRPDLYVHSPEAPGTPDWHAPEVIISRSFSPASDVFALGGLLYAMLTGCAPFLQDKYIRQRIVWEPLRSDEASGWPFLSADARDLVSRMLEKNPAKRITMAQVTAHPWLRSARADAALPLALTNLQAFNATRRVRAAVRAVMFGAAAGMRLRVIRAVSGRSGSDVGLLTACAGAGAGVGGSGVATEGGSSSSSSAGAFPAAASAAGAGMEAAGQQQALAFKLTAAQLSAITAAFDEALPADPASRSSGSGGGSGSGSARRALSFTQFCSVLARLRIAVGFDVDTCSSSDSTSAGASAGAGALPSLSAGSSAPASASNSMLRRLFAALDVDGSGDIDVRELTVGLAVLLAAPDDSDAALRVVFSLYDADGDGALTLEELALLLQCLNPQPSSPSAAPSALPSPVAAGRPQTRAQAGRDYSDGVSSGSAASADAFSTGAFAGAGAGAGASSSSAATAAASPSRLTAGSASSRSAAPAPSPSPSPVPSAQELIALVGTKRRRPEAFDAKERVLAGMGSGAGDSSGRAGRRLGGRAGDASRDRNGADDHDDGDDDEARCHARAAIGIDTAASIPPPPPADAAAADAATDDHHLDSLMVGGHAVSPALLTALRALFARVDADGDGRLSYREFAAAVRGDPALACFLLTPLHAARASRSSSLIGSA